MCLRCILSPSSFQFFENFQRSKDDEKQMGGEEEGQEATAEGGVEVDEER